MRLLVCSSQAYLRVALFATESQIIRCNVKANTGHYRNNGFANSIFMTHVEVFQDPLVGHTPQFEKP